jgi:hypothetical protein
MAKHHLNPSVYILDALKLLVVNEQLYYETSKRFRN